MIIYGYHIYPKYLHTLPLPYTSEFLASPFYYQWMCLNLLSNSYAEWVYTVCHSPSIAGCVANCVDSFSSVWSGVLWFHVGRLCVHLSIFSFSDDNLIKHQWTFTILGMCIDIVEIWFGIAYGQISSIFNIVICPPHVRGRVLCFILLSAVKSMYIWWK